MKRDYIECQCEDISHLIRISQEEGFLDNLLYLEVRLNQHLNIFQRIWQATLYVFKFKGTSQYDCVIIKPNDVQKIIDILQDYQNDKNI
jgi:hypothetical protein